MIVTPAVRDYLDATRPPADPLLAELQAHGARERIPILDAQSGALLHVLARAIGARRVVEVGTAIGVSTLHLARALPDEGELVSFEIDRQRHAAAQGYLERAGLGTVAENASDGHWTEEQIATARAFNAHLLDHPQLVATITPVGDGIALAARR
jgi:predicted O-methyltransferase YrrM